MLDEKFKLRLLGALFDLASVRIMCFAPLWQPPTPDGTRILLEPVFFWLDPSLKEEMK